MTALAELIEAHRGAFEYDWRTRFQLPLTCIGDSMSWGEAVRLARTLRSDPSSALAAAVEGWDYTMSREALMLVELFDLEHAKAGVKNPKPHWMRPVRPTGVTRGNSSGRTNAEIMALLRP